MFGRPLWSYPKTLVDFTRDSYGVEAVCLASGEELRLGSDVLARTGDLLSSVSARVQGLGEPEFYEDWDPDTGFYVMYLYQNQLMVEFRDGRLDQISLSLQVPAPQPPEVSKQPTKSPRTLK